MNPNGVVSTAWRETDDIVLFINEGLRDMLVPVKAAVINNCSLASLSWT